MGVSLAVSSSSDVETTAECSIVAAKVLLTCRLFPAVFVTTNREPGSLIPKREKFCMWKSTASTRYSSLSLKDIVCLCAVSADDEAWEEFVTRVATPISLTIMRTASLWGVPSKSLVEDLIQVTFLKLWEGGRRLLHEFALQHPEAILGYLKRTAANVAHDYFKHGHNQSSGGDRPHVSTSDVDPEASDKALGSQNNIDHEILLAEIDELLKRCAPGPDQERDRTIFWLYFRQGMSTREIASLPTMELSAKGVGSVIERLKRCIREDIVGERLAFQSTLEAGREEG
jgi:RNA polymerase sigma-70 factor (ECF subfamily)